MSNLDMKFKNSGTFIFDASPQTYSDPIFILDCFGLFLDF